MSSTGLLALAVLLLAAMFLFPPYFGVDSASHGSVHAFVGYYPLWAPPSSNTVRQALLVQGRIPPEPSPTPANPANRYVAYVNRVRLVAQLAAVIVAAAGVGVCLRRGRIG